MNAYNRLQSFVNGQAAIYFKLKPYSKWKRKIKISSRSEKIKSLN